VAVGDSLQGGGNDSRSTSGASESAAGAKAACGSTPLTVEQGSSSTLNLDARALNGFQVASAVVQAVSANASVQSVTTRTQGTSAVVFEARNAPGPAGRVDEYKLTLTLARGEDRVVSECQVLVRAPGAAGGGGAPVVGTPAPVISTQPAAGAASATPVRTATAPPASTPAATPPPGATPTRVP
jgi:hypothetical protein